MSDATPIDFAARFESGLPGVDEPPAILTITMVEQSRITLELTPDQARQLFGLGGTDDENLATSIWALAERRPAVLARAARQAESGVAYSWLLNEIRDPWNY